jgi:hypothetical protein
VPYNLFRLFLVHKIPAYKYIYENGKKKWEKKKEKGFLASWAEGGILAQPGASARAAAWAGGPLGPPAGETAGNGAVARAHMPGRGRGLTAFERRRGGGSRPEFGRRWNPRRFSAVVPVLRRGGGGEARAGAGDHRGGANLTCGGLWRPVRGAVTGVRGGDVAGAVAGHNRRGKVVPCDRESVAELRAQFNWTEDH